MQHRNFLFCSRARRKAFVGIGTLIVFIATILTAAIAAGVIIQTSGVLQERSYAVAGQARQRLLTGLEVTEVYGNSDISANSDATGSIDQLEIGVRLRPGASEVNLRTMALSYSSNEVALSATLQHSSVSAFNMSFADYNITNTSWTALPDDMNKDQITDYVKVGEGATADYLLFNISGIGIANASLGTYIRNASTTPVNLSLDQVPVMIGQEIYGYVTGNVTVNTSNEISPTSADSFYVTQFPRENICNFNNLIPDRFFCYVVKIGNSNPILEAGESMVLYYKLNSTNMIPEDTQFQLSFVPKDGAITYLDGQTPAVVRKSKILIWPQ